jgi:hypothetical protein
MEELLQETPYDIICMSETFLNRIKLETVQLDGYIVAASYCRENHKRGGVIILTREGIEYIERKDISNLSIEFVVEYCSVEIHYLNILILSVYWNGRDMDIFLESFKKLLEKLKMERHKSIVIGGDFNIDMLSNKKTSIDFKNLMLTYNYEQLVKTPTRICNTVATYIDLVFTNFDDVHTEVKELGLSDHHGVSVVINTKTLTRINKSQTINKRIYSEVQIIQFRDVLRKINWENLLHETYSINKNYNIFHTTLTMLLNKFIPKKEIKINKTCDRAKWITKGIKISCNHKRLLRILVNHTNNNIIKQYYRHYRKTLKKTVIISKKQIYISQMAKSENKTKTMWQIIKTKTNKTNTNSFKNIILHKNKDIIESPTRIANCFNKFFATVGRPSEDQNTRIKPHTYSTVKNSIYLEPTNGKEVIKILQNLKNKYSAGDDNIPPILLKKCASELTEPLNILINQSFNEGKFPDLLKTTIIRPIHKKGNKNDPSHYRPIALLPSISKIFERIMTNRLCSFFEKYKILDDRQYGFRKNRSTTLAVFRYVQQILDQINEGGYAIGILLDMSKAYDRVRHDLLLSKLHCSGIRGNAYDWIASYLHNRIQYVQVEYSDPKSGKVTRFASDRVTMNCSIPQGSVIGCILFLIYINDLPKIAGTPCVLFADDVSILQKF